MKINMIEEIERLKSTGDLSYTSNCCDLADKLLGFIRQHDPNLEYTADSLQILTRLILGLPLTPLECDEENWIFLSNFSYVHRRYPDLHRYVNCVTHKWYYTDSNRFVFHLDTWDSVEVKIPALEAHLNKYYPIQFPYLPSINKFHILYSHKVCPSSDNTEVVRIISIRDPVNSVEQVDKFFKVIPDGYEELNLNEYLRYVVPEELY